MPSPTPVEQAEALAAAGRIEEAARQLSGAAASGDAGAAHALANWRIAGDRIRRDLPEARRLLGAAAAGGHVEAALLLANFLAAGIGGAADWPGALHILEQLRPASPGAAAQLDLLSAMDLDGNGAPRSVPERRLVSEAPRVTLGEGLLSPRECDYLREVGAPMLQPSTIIDPQSGRLVPHPIRTSDGAAFGVHSEDLVVNAINRRIAAFSGTSVAQGEPLQLLSYRPGAEYRAHLDAVGGEENQRILTAIVYLTDDYQGGETAFLRTGFTIRGRAGDAILFRNVTPDGRPDPQSLHAGRPVEAGVKLIATRWIRRAPFSYPPPVPLLPL